MKVQILTARPVGDNCIKWAKQNLPKGWSISSSTSIIDSSADVVISVMYDKILKDLNSDVRYYNFHLGILPEYAGSCALSWAILNGEDKTGITLHVLSDGVDTGNIIEIRKFPISDTDTAQNVAEKAMEIIFLQFKDWFTKLLIQAEIPSYKQDLSKRHVYKRQELHDALDLTRYIRAFTFEGKPPPYFTTRDGQRIELSYE